MKKNILLWGLALLLGNAGFAQLNNGGIPLGTQQKIDNQFVPHHTYATPNFATAVALQEQQEINKSIVKPFLVALGAPVDIGFPQSGMLVTTADNKLVWRASVQIEGGKGIGFCYDNFQLPAGVRCYITNQNGDQLLGAYTNANNQSSKLFASEPIQGTVANIELDIEPDVNLDDIHLHINKAAVYFRGVDYLQAFGGTASKPTIDGVDSALANNSSVCMVDAICPVANAFINQKKATLSIVIPDTSNTNFGWCSATMINRVGNTPTSCKNFLITASHCDGSNSTSKDRYDQMLLRFNFEENTCNSNAIPGANTLVGTNFVARTNLDTVNFILKGDFLLLLPQTTIPSSWDVTMAGWNRDTAISFFETAPREFVSYFHPIGDVKKVATSHHIGTVPFMNGSTENTHWTTTFDTGYVAPGASGGGLYSGDGYFIGSLSGAVLTPYNGCSLNRNGDTAQIILGKTGLYSKISYNWSNNDTAIRKLQPWLDPTNTGVLKINGQKTTCEALDSTGTITAIHAVSMDRDISIYPNPVASGTVNLQFNLPDVVNLKIDLFDFSGKLLKTYNVSKVKSGVYTMNVEGFASGLYMLRISDGTSISNKKLMIKR